MKKISCALLIGLLMIGLTSDKRNETLYELTMLGELIPR